MTHDHVDMPRQLIETDIQHRFYFQGLTIAAVPPPVNATSGSEENGEEATHAAAVSIMVQIIMLGISFLVGHMLRRNKIMVIHEAGTALGLGVLVGLFVRLVGQAQGFRSWINFNESFFFYFLLPPIIFESGWSLRSKPFFHNFGAICVFAFLGTAISTFGVGILIYIFGTLNWTYSMPFLACLAYGALISATDPVTVLAIFHALGADANLYAYVFGESVLNDAVAIVMYKTVLSFIKHPESTGIFSAFWFFIAIFIGSFSIGVLTSMLSAVMFRHCGLQEKGLAILESCLMALFPYLAYNMADALELSGIVAILFAGITMKYYTAPNLSSEAQQITTSFFGMLSKLSETFVFIYMGVALFLEEQSWNNFGFTVFTIISILVARAWNVYPCAALLNNFREPARQIPMNQQHALWYGGLRGAMAFALALQSVQDIPDHHGRVMLTATMFTIFFTVILIGGTTYYALMYLNIECHGPDYHGAEETVEYDRNVDGFGIKALKKQKALIKNKLRKLKNYEFVISTPFFRG
ncbi:sodium/hydrogen exchanger 5 [Selaginella moellendorffii]|uniref:sodium/hydrogen exchanger 5 n=1 Tax=Selaginella moellendorffii TaxID=88036 RepID=UPI000D1C7C36|nr:sodium/hydrogen exchanger 5 [Selaginella moellendorffii]|eukprot:XP_024541576.1 sodium/hydrogen exchanger 5 [Selaginella moellendorffii]